MPLSFSISPKGAANWRIYTATFADGEVQLNAGKTLAEYGFYNGRLHRENLQADSLTLTKAVSKFDATTDIPYGQLIALQDNRGQTRFVGTRIVVPASASASEEVQEYEFLGPWHWLQRIVYRQTWKQLLVDGQLVPRTTSHLLLNGTDYRTVGLQIADAANFAIGQGAPFQLGTIDIPIVPFMTEITDQTCAQVIADQLRFAPDAVAWFDYSTNTPTLHVRQASNLTPVSLTLGPGQPISIADEGISITARPDEQVASVSLRYERTDTQDGKEYLKLAEDVYPVGSPGTGLNAVHATITLAGYNRTTVRASIVCEQIDTGSVDWWKRVVPRLDDPRIKNLAISNVERVIAGSRSEFNPNGDFSSEHPRMLVEGQLAEWMSDVTDNALQWEQEEISAEFTFDLDVDPSSGVKLEKVSKLRIPVQLVSTTAPDGESSYWALESEEEGEQAPAGLAQYLYESMSPLQYEGSVSTTQQEVTGYIGPGNRLNILGTQDVAHASMNARVQSVDEYIDSGSTSVRFGATPSLSLGSILEFMRATRHRRRWTRSQVQENGENPSNTTVELGQATANINTVEGDRQNKLFACVDGQARLEMDASKRKLTIETRQKVGKMTHEVGDDWAGIVLTGSNENNYSYINAITGEAAMKVKGANGEIVCDTFYCKGKRLSPREEVWCNPDTGERKKIMVIASDPY